VKYPELTTAAQFAEFADIIDVRSPAEYAKDHLPGASNYPVLNDGERERVGTLYKHSPFEAKKLGAVLVARNIAQHLEQSWQNQPRAWQPLIYCARGGQRSGALTHILRQIGFNAARLEGGYKNYRQYVLQQLAIIPAQLTFYVLCGLTGSGKSRLLNALKQNGAQVLDMEQIAQHRGSVLGDVIHATQPTQKAFDSQILAQLKSFDFAKPIFIESESKKIGSVRVPDKLIEKMWGSPCIRLETPTPLRIELLREDYTHFLQHPALLHTLLRRLKGAHSNAQITHWQALCEAHAWDTLITELLEQHYDPAYNKSIHSHYPNLSDAPQLVLKNSSESAFNRLAHETLALTGNFVNNADTPFNLMPENSQILNQQMLDQPIINFPVADFTLPATDQVDFNLASARGKTLVIYFYPKDNTPGCITESQQFRDLYDDFQHANCEVVGISRDSIKSHENFKARFSLPFTLLSDSEEKVCTQFGVIKMKNMYGKQVRGIERSTFVLDQHGVLRREWRGVKADGHAQEVLQFVQTL